RPIGGLPPWFIEDSLPHLLLRNNSIKGEPARSPREGGVTGASRTGVCIWMIEQKERQRKRPGILQNTESLPQHHRQRTYAFLSRSLQGCVRESFLRDCTHTGTMPWGIRECKGRALNTT